MLRSTYDVFRKFGGPAKLGRAIGVTTEHASGMKRRNSIPVRYWPALVSVAAELGFGEINEAMLARLHADLRETTSCDTRPAA